MEQILLGIAGASAADAGNHLHRATRTVLEPFANILHSVSQTLSYDNSQAELPSETSEGKLAKRLEETLSAAGIEITEPLKLTTIDGKLVVVGDHPQRALIEAALGRVPSLADDLNRLFEEREGTSFEAGEFSSPPFNPIPRMAVLSRVHGEPRLEIG